MPTIRIQMPNHMELTHRLSGDRITIGREPDNTIQITDWSVSAHHAEFIAEDGYYRLHDLESTNLTFVDGQPVTDFHLHQACRIAFGTVDCVFDPVASSAVEGVMTRQQLEKDASFLRSQNAELQAKLTAQQRRVDMLSSARLVTGRTDSTPSAAAQDALRAVSSERDDLRHTVAGLKLEMANLREKYSVASQERDTLRRAVEALQMEKLGLARELHELRGTRVKPVPPMNGAPIRPAPKSGALSPLNQGAAPKAPRPIEPAFQPVAAILTPLRAALERVRGVPEDDVARMELMTLATQLVDCTADLQSHPIAHAAASVEALLHELLARPGALEAGSTRTVNQELDMLRRIVERGHLEPAKTSPQANVLAMEDEAEMPASLVAAR